METIDDLDEALLILMLMGREDAIPAYIDLWEEEHPDD